MNPWIAAGIGWGIMAVVMAALWRYARVRRNYGYVDVAWSFGVGVCVVVFALCVEGELLRRVIVMAMALIWSGRLTLHLFQRVHNAEEDGRYHNLRRRWGGSADRNFFVFFQVQAGWCVLFALPMCGAMTRPGPSPDVLDAVGVALWLVAVSGESIADSQLARFRAEPTNRGRVCDVGLWRWSRHPNYFFEWVGWWAYVAIGVVGPLGVLTLLGPMLMLVFLFVLTGVPATEYRALMTRGDAYREYQIKTSVFVPWPPRRKVQP